MKKNEKNFSIKGKLLKYCELHNITKNEFYLKCDLSNGFLDKDRGFNTDNLVKILTAYPDIDVNWLLFGEGDMPKNEVIGNTAGGDIIANGSTKAVNEEIADAVNKLTDANLLNAQTISEQTNQIGMLIKIIADK